MSSFEVLAEHIRITPHPNADRLEMAQVGLYSAVVGKGQFQDGELALYIPEQGLLPDWLVTELGLEGKLAGKAANRVKAVRLRSVLSQGIVAKVGILTLVEHETPAESLLTPREVDFADILGIEKWKPEVPIHMTGEMMSDPNTILPWTDMENIHRYPEIFMDGEEVVLTEKIHGTCLISTTFFDEEVERTAVVSKGLAAKGISFVENDANLYWGAVKNNPIREAARELKEFTEKATGEDVIAVGIYGEVFGKGIQDLHYGIDKPQFRMFDAQIRFAGGETQWVDTADIRNLETPIQHVPLIWQGAYDIETIASFASGNEQVSGKESNIREGVVIRPTDASKRWGAGNKRRKIAKFVTAEYLSRKGGTEYN